MILEIPLWIFILLVGVCFGIGHLKGYRTRKKQEPDNRENFEKVVIYFDEEFNLIKAELNGKPVKKVIMKMIQKGNYEE